MTFMRSILNPLIRPEDVLPSNSEMEVIGVFNPGVAQYRGETVLLVRVAERPKQLDATHIAVPVFDPVDRNIGVQSFVKADPENDSSDVRVLRTRHRDYLTSISHFRLARVLADGSISVDARPAMMPNTAYETYGIEDPRITEIDGTYYITYSAVSDRGIVTVLARTLDFIEFLRLGIIFHPDNKDVALFPGTIDGRFYALHRPSTSTYGSPEIWLAESPDLLHWGNHQRLMGVRPGQWDSHRIGAGAVPFLTADGWLEIYHGADENNRYCLGAVLLDRDAPWKVIARTTEPLLLPAAPYEAEGFYPNVVFSCGAVCVDDRVTVFYGAGDSTVASAQISLVDVLNVLDASPAISA